MIRRALDLVYDAAAVLAGLALVALLAVILAQIVLRPLGIPFPGGTDYAGYLMAAASFLALAHTLRRGAHIRVELVLQHLHGRPRRLLEIAAALVGTGLAWWFAWYAVRGVRISRMLGDVSQGQDATPLWIPQLAMAVGAVLFAVAMTDRLVTVVRRGDPTVGAERPAEV